VLTKLEALPFATIAAIDGAALGGGLEVALACDFRIVGSNPKIQLGLPETTLGLMPGWGGSQRLPRIVGVEVAARMLRTAKSVSAAEAVANDLAVEQVQSDGLIDAAAAVLVNLTSQMKHEARALKSRPMTQVTPAAIEATDDEGIRAALTAMNTGVVLPLEDGLRLENHAFLSLTGTPESKRRISEFFNRKK
jgi:enoyl-CoA hydratase/carnithine racemase